MQRSKLYLMKQAVPHSQAEVVVSNLLTTFATPSLDERIRQDTEIHRALSSAFAHHSSARLM
jgi:hypothetical protein